MKIEYRIWRDCGMKDLCRAVGEDDGAATSYQRFIVNENRWTEDNDVCGVFFGFESSTPISEEEAENFRKELLRNYAKRKDRTSRSSVEICS